MPVNRDIISKFIIDDRFDYTIEISIKGDTLEDGRRLLNSMAFDVSPDEYEFFGTPPIDLDQRTERILIVRKHQ